MPELPEVETIARGLDARLRGRRVSGVEISWPRAVDAASIALDALAGETVGRVRRAGKFIVLEFGSGRKLAVHLRMTGRLIFSTRIADLPYTRVRLSFEDGSQLAFADARKFGRLRVFDGNAQRALRLGVDALSVELTECTLRTFLRRRKTPIKVWLLDQRHLSGVGNIYACEALYHAGVRPKKRAASLTAAQRRRLLASLRTVLRKAIHHRGASVDDYVDVEGKQGGFQKLLAVYGRAGLPCRRCGTSIKRIVLAQRGTFYCPACQQ